MVDLIWVIGKYNPRLLYLLIYYLASRPSHKTCIKNQYQYCILGVCNVLVSVIVTEHVIECQIMGRQTLK